MLFGSFILFSLLNLVLSKFTIDTNQILFNNEPISIRGISWYGFETELRVVEGLGEHSMDWYIDLLKELKFNAIRIPFSVQLMHYEPTAIPARNNTKMDPSLYNLRCSKILEILVQKCQDNGIAVLLDCHVLKIKQPHPLWYLQNDTKYSEEILFENWGNMITTFENNSNIIGIELINEPHDIATYGSGNISTDVDSMIKRFLDTFPNTPLVFIDGIAWGSEFRNITSLDPNRIVYAPHLYGPTLAPLTSYSLEYITWRFNLLFGFLISKHPVVITEWGINPKTDMDWVINFILYMQNNNLSSAFFWSLNPIGKDIQGLLDDWNTVDQTRFKFIEQLTPNPTNFTFI
jgi:endoglucanase